MADPDTPSISSNAAVLCGAFTLWVLASEVFGIGAHGWWTPPVWWPSWAPEIIQVLALLLPFATRALFQRSLPPTHDYGLTTALGGLVLFTQSPYTDVVHLPVLPVRIWFLVAGSIVLTRLSAHPRRLQVLLAVVVLSAPVMATGALLTDGEALISAFMFYLTDLALPGQLSSLLLRRIPSSQNRRHGNAA